MVKAPDNHGRPAAQRLRPGRRWTLAIELLTLGPAVVLAGSPRPTEPQFYSTAAPPADYSGPAPLFLALAETPVAVPEADPDPAPAATTETDPESNSPARQPQPEEAPRVATAPATSIPPQRPRPAAPAEAHQSPDPPAEASPVVRAKQLIASCQERFRLVQDYTCTFLKRERIDERLTPYHIMNMKARTQPTSFYFKFQKPTPGREAIFVTGRHGGRVLAHDVGIGKVLAGTLVLDPRGSRAMEDCRHPITEAGIGHMIETVADRWNAEMREGETVVTIHADARVGNRSCTMIESTHPQHLPRYMFCTVKVYIDKEL